MTLLESLVKTILAIFTSKAANGSVTTTSSYVALVTQSTPARIVYISNTTGKVLYVKQNGADIYLPDGAIFPLNNISDLNTISVRTSDSTAALTVTFRYEL
jgi:hypothetical protein